VLSILKALRLLSAKRFLKCELTWRIFRPRPEDLE
jgi:hypothetical protein